MIEHCSAPWIYSRAARKGRIFLFPRKRTSLNTASVARKRENAGAWYAHVSVGGVGVQGICTGSEVKVLEGCYVACYTDKSFELLAGFEEGKDDERGNDRDCSAATLLRAASDCTPGCVSRRSMNVTD